MIFLLIDSKISKFYTVALNHRILKQTSYQIMHQKSSLKIQLNIYFIYYIYYYLSIEFYCYYHYSFLIH